MVSKTELIRAARGGESLDGFDFALPDALMGKMSQQDWAELIAGAVEDALYAVFNGLENGVLKYRHTYFEDSGEGDCKPVYADFEQAFDWVPPALELADLPPAERRDKAAWQLWAASRATPDFNICQDDYDYALRSVYLGWQRQDFHMATSDGFWSVQLATMGKHCLRREFLPGIDAIPYLQVEDFLQFPVTKDLLEGWGVDEAQFFENILEASLNETGSDMTIEDCSFEDGSLDFWRIRREIAGKVPETLTMLEQILPECIGQYGTVVAIPDETVAYVFAIHEKKQLYYAMITALQYFEQEFEYSAHEYNPFRDPLFWYENGVFHKVIREKVIADTDDLSFNIQLPPYMIPLFPNEETLD